jgi:rRNA maturation protein Rpf1
LKTGPTAYFKLSNFEPGAKIPGHGKSTNHVPELILNNFSTRLGRRIGRFLGSFFPHVSDIPFSLPYILFFTLISISFSFYVVLLGTST